MDASADATLSEHACVVANRSRDTWASAQEGAFNISAFRTDIIDTVLDTQIHLVSLVLIPGVWRTWSLSLGLSLVRGPRW